MGIPDDRFLDSSFGKNEPFRGPLAGPKAVTH